jgi:prepilin-type N-terminal cleavage/methylation domain-containing protein
MKTEGHRRVKGGFTLSEVLLAVAIIAFGLVAVFSVLPFGLKAQKDNREETIIRYEAEYWLAALQSGGVPLESMDRVETVELTDASGEVYRINRHNLVPENPNNPTDVALAEAALAGWPVDICGWLSAPDYIWSSDNAPQKIPRVPAKFARVWAINGSLYDRLYSHRGKDGHYLDGGEFTFSYFLETKVEPVIDTGCRITIVFHWPISEPIENALKAGTSMEKIMANTDLRPASSKAFSILTNLRPRPMISNANLNARQFQFMRASLPGDDVSIEDLKAKFSDRYSQFPWDGYPRRMSLDAMGDVRVQVLTPNDGWRYRDEPEVGTIEDKLSEAFRDSDDRGLYLYIDNVAYSIKEVHPNGHFLTLMGGAFNPTPPNEFRGYRVSFLGPSESWEGLLSDYQRFGLVVKRGDKYRIESIYNSWALREFKNSANLPFSVTLDAQDYWPTAPPSAGTKCSFWFLK